MRFDYSIWEINDPFPISVGGQMLTARPIDRAIRSRGRGDRLAPINWPCGQHLPAYIISRIE